MKESIRYFHHHIWLNSYYFIADENILRIDENTDALLAKYGESDNWYLLLLVRYPTEDKGTRAYHDFMTGYLPELAEEQALQIEDGTWTGAQLHRNYLIIVFQAPTKDKALRLLEEVQQNIGQ
jgi:hypothetical protein